MTGLLIALAIQVLVSVALIVWTRSRIRGALGSDEEIGRIRREIGSLIIELDASADRNITVLEDRLATLKEMVAETDKRIAILSQDRGKRQVETPVYDRLGRTAPQRPRSEAASQTAGQTANRDGIEIPEKPVDRPVGQPVVPSDIPFIRFSEKPLSIEEPFADKVLSLARKGFSSDIIAARLGGTITEVELVLSMEREREGRTKDI
jgi:hypothetical protein